MNRISNFTTFLKQFSKLSLNNEVKQIKNNIGRRNLSTTTSKCDLMEFFDDKKNWGSTEVRSGRSWKKEELRLKSNIDLHKLWYVLLKERNMLLTMEQDAKDQIRLFPSPERLDKVEESMENLETVVRERNQAYHLLETGETGERPGKLMTGPFGLRFYYRMRQHLVPQMMNRRHRQTHQLKYYPNADTEAFLLKYREKLYMSKKRQDRRNFQHVIGLMNRFPNMDMEALKEQYPDVDIEKVKRSRKYGGHFVPQ